MSHVTSLREAMVRLTTVPDTAVIKLAEQQIKKCLASPSCISALMTLLTTYDDATAGGMAVRQLSAVLLRMKIGKYWDMLGEELQGAVRRGLLEALVKEPQRIIRVNIAYVISTLSKHQVVIVNGEEVWRWDELLQFLSQMVQSTEAEQRELAMTMFYTLTETVGVHLTQFHGEMQRMYFAALGDADGRVRVAALKAAGALVEFLSSGEEVLQFRSLLEPMLKTLKLCASSSSHQCDESVSIQIVEVMGELMESPVPLLNPHLGLCAETLLEIALDSGLEVGTRDAAVVVVNSMMEAKTRFLCKTGKGVIIQGIIQAAFRILAEGVVLEEENGEEEDDEGGENTVKEIGQSLVDAMALSLPKRHVFEPLMRESASRIASAQDPRARRVGLMALTHAAEGLADNLREVLDQVLPPVLQCAVRDQDAKVRAEGCLCLGQIAQYAQPEVCEYHAQVVPHVCTMLESGQPFKVRVAALYVIEAFCMCPETEFMAPYVPACAEKLLLLAASETDPSDIRGTGLRAQALSTLSSLMIAAPSSYAPLYEKTLPLISQLMQLQDSRMSEIRGRATETLGHLALVTKEANCPGTQMNPANFAALLPDILRHALAVINTESDEMSEFTYGLFSNLATSLGPFIDPFANDIIPALLSGIARDDGVSRKVVDRDGGAISSEMLQRFGDGDGEDEDEAAYTPGAKVTLNIRTAMLESKMAAMYALGQLCDNLSPQAIQPHLENILEAMALSMGHLHESVRSSAIKALTKTVVAVHRAESAASAAASSSTPQHGSTVEQVLSGLFFPLVTELMVEDEEKVVVSGCCTAIQDIIEGVGPSCLGSGRVDTIMNIMVNLFQKRAACFRFEDAGEDEDDEEDDAEHDNILIDALSDCVGAIAKACGREFTRYLGGIYDPLMKYTRASRPTYDRIMALGLLAEIVQGITTAAEQYVGSLLPLALQSMNDPHPGVKRNAAFLCGMVMRHGGAAAASQTNAALSALFPLTNELEGAKRGATSFAFSDRQAVVDNACGAIARILLAVSPAQLPLSQVLPPLFVHLPLKFDHEEDGVVFEALAHLTHAAWSEVHPHLERMLEIVATALAPGNVAELTADARKAIASLLGLLTRAHAQETMAAASKLSADAQACLQSGMTANGA